MSNIIPRMLVSMIIFICSLGMPDYAKEERVIERPVLQTQEKVPLRAEGNRRNIAKAVREAVVMLWNEMRNHQNEQTDKDKEAESVLARQREYARQSMREYRICMSGLLLLMMVGFMILLIKKPCHRKRKKEEKE